MTRGELLVRMTSQELTAWLALFEVHAEEARHERDKLESGDGIVHISGLDDDDEEPEDGHGGE